MRRLPHGYTNLTNGDRATVVKHYQGPDAALRLERERLLITDLAGTIPVPPLLGAGEGALTLGFVEGAPGQELLDTDAAAVLRSCGTVLRRIHAVASSLGEGVLVHGDFGPNNLLLDPGTFAVTAVVDWEFAHLGDPVEDLAWCEWIVRMHHPDRVAALDAFFAAYGAPVPDWPLRRAAMVDRCVELREFCRRWDPDGPAVAEWERRIGVTASW
ncbi:phosphotransferase [Glycomyces luteolus]|uniref:Phosphotransferase n=1 Tax=Glycomyces luteolus TaxID=2670330 RepID=A0A9X3PBH7_9ACTN|nr:phosphotransferase [Glycomyces luteolus]MDA1359524.1 phosphotransferase [Glycomyces luteolus]